MTEWQSIDLEELETERVPCDCCGKASMIGNGHLWRADEFLGWYRVSASENDNTHPPIITIYVGDWSESAQKSERWGVQIHWHEAGCGVLDWAEEEIASINQFTPLGRDDVLGSSFEPQLWSLVDAVIMKDSRLKDVQP